MLSGRYPQRRGSLLIQKTVQKTVILTQRTVAQKTISIQGTVVEEHGVDTEGGGGEGGFNTEGSGGRVISIRWVVGSFDKVGGSGEDSDRVWERSWERSYLLLCQHM